MTWPSAGKGSAPADPKIWDNDVDCAAIDPAVCKQKTETLGMRPNHRPIPTPPMAALSQFAPAKLFCETPCTTEKPIKDMQTDMTSFPRSGIDTSPKAGSKETDAATRNKTRKKLSAYGTQSSGPKNSCHGNTGDCEDRFGTNLFK